LKGRKKQKEALVKAVLRKAKLIIMDYRVIVLLFFLLAALFAISPMPWRDGVIVRSVVKNSSAYNAGLQPDAKLRPTARERIISIDNLPVRTVDDYNDYISSIEPNRTVLVRTNVQTYRMVSDENGSLGIRVAQAPTNNLRKGLDLTGGIRVVLKPERPLAANETDVLDFTVESLRQRLNVYGLSDIVVQKITWPEQYVLVEVADATEEEVKELIGSQGKFEAKIANKTVFSGGADIKYVAFSGQYARIENCDLVSSQDEPQYMCRFSFAITISQEAAERQSDATAVLSLDPDATEYLNDSIYLYLDNEEVDSLRIGADLKGRPVTEIAISGPGFGRTEAQAYEEAVKNMKKLQTILKTGSLPIKLEFAQTKIISAPLGDDFTKNSINVGLIAIFTVAAVIFVRFRKLKIAIPTVLTMMSEIILILGFAALAGWRLDLAAIAGIIVAAGTGVDDQIVIVDEVLRGELQPYNWKKKVMQAFFIIMAAYFTTAVAILPLYFTGAGLLKLFALTTFVGITFGVLVTRRAFAAIIEILLKD
jgi:preprotein translocase subunit SecD